jgi:hypothetical protein
VASGLYVQLSYDNETGHADGSGNARGTSPVKSCSHVSSTGRLSGGRFQNDNMMRRGGTTGNEIQRGLIGGFGSK